MFSSFYGSSDAYYGNIELAYYAPIPSKYGAWPEQNTAPEMLDWKEPEVIDPKVNVEIIRRLKAELEATQDLQMRQQIRNDLEAARQQKVKAFQLAARAEREEEELFMLLH